MAKCPDVILRLIERFTQQSDQVRSPDYNETQLRIDFINPMFVALGWDIDNSQGNAEQYREVVHEDRVRVGGQTKAPDYSFRIGGTRKYFLEAKKPSVNIKQLWEPAYQLRRYGWSAKLAVSLLTNFAELAIYDCRIAPKQLDKPATARRDYMSYGEYPDRWDFIEGTFSKRAVLQGEFDRYCQLARGRGRQEFDDTFLEEIEEWRKKLAGNLALRNDGLDESSLNFSVQRIIDRIIFLRMAEDRGTEVVGQLQALLGGEHTYSRLQNLFRDADARYNSGLFHFAVEKSRDETPDTLTPALNVDDSTLKSIIRRLYYPESPYEFTVVTADILGNIYERFLGNVITLTAGHRARIQEKPEVRKAGGVYYTPAYIVDYIVNSTVGKLLQGKTPKDAARLKVLDPACGSGSFLIGAYQFLLDWHLAHYLAAEPRKLAAGKSARLRPGPAGDWRLTIAERKRILLDNIHGVDLDGAAVEVTKLNLLLKCLEGETSQTLGFQQRLFRDRALPDLGKNILCGNSLICTDIMATEGWHAMSDDERIRINPFDYERAFSKAFKQGGFDAVIGNPPYVRMEGFVPAKAYLSEHFRSHEERADLYSYFLELGLRLLSRDGILGEIVSNKFIKAKYGRPLRGLIHDAADVSEIADFAGANVFRGATVRTVVLVMRPKAAVAQPTRYIPVPPPSTIDAFASSHRGMSEYAASNSVLLAPDALDPAEWRLTSQQNSALISRLRDTCTTLSNVLNGRALFGCKTGCNEAFIVGAEQRDLLDPAHNLLKPILFGKDIKRYGAAFAGRFVIYFHPDKHPDDYPAAMAHLLTFREKLQARAGPQQWWELQQPAVALLRFQNEAKIIYPIIANECRFALDTNGFLINDKAFILPTSDLSVLGILNSRLANFYFSEVCAALEGENDRYLEFRAQYVDRFPMPDPLSAGDREQTASAVSTLISLRNRLGRELLPQRREQIARQIDATERQIDELVYKLYDLSGDEIRVVEEAASRSALQESASSADQREEL